jgi:hypothetical protein
VTHVSEFIDFKNAILDIFCSGRWLINCCWDPPGKGDDSGPIPVGWLKSGSIWFDGDGSTLDFDIRSKTIKLFPTKP